MGKKKVVLTARGNEQLGSYFLEYFNNLPSAATEGGTLISNSETAYIGRAEVGIIFQKDIWGLYDISNTGPLIDKLIAEIPGKPVNKLIAICGAIKQSAKAKSLDDLWIQFDAHYRKEIDFKGLVVNTGLSDEAWGYTGKVFPQGGVPTRKNRDGTPRWDYGGSSAIGPLTALMYQFTKTSEYSNIVAGNPAALEASGYLSGDGAGELSRINAAAANVTDDLQTFNEDQRAVQALEAAQEDELNKNPDSKEALSEEQKIQRVKFQTQCLLAANLHQIAQYSKQVRSKTTPAYRKTYMLEGEPYKLVNKLTYTEGSAAFANITVPEVSSLVPMIRLEKLRYDSKGKHVDSIPIVFDTFTKEEDILAADSGGRSGVGIKSFDWDYNGTNIATVKSDVTARLVLYFQTFNDLLAYNHLGFRYVDLLIRSDPPSGEDNAISGPDADKQNLNNVNDDSKHFEIKATVGWAYNNDYILDYENKKDLEKGMRSQRATLFLTLVEHEFDIAQDGTFTLTINYRARLDGMFMDKRADVFLGFKEKAHLCELNEKLDDAKSVCDEDEITRIKKKITSSKEEFAFDTNTQIMDELLSSGKIYYGKLSKDVLMEYDYDVFEIPASRLELISGNKLMEVTEDMLMKFRDEAMRETASDYGEVLRSRGLSTIDYAECENSTVGTVAARTGYVIATVGSAFNTAVEAVTGVDLDGDVSVQTNEDGSGRELGCFEAGFQAGNFDTSALEGITNISAPNPEGLEKVGLRNLPTNNGDKMIPYFFLGDLIDIAANKALGSSNQSIEGNCNAYINPSRTKNMSILLGSINVTNIGKDSAGASNREGLVNIGDIPVALEYFRDFWARRVTKQKKTTYSLNNFIKDCLRDFGTRSLGEQCFPERASRMQIKDATIMIPAVKNGAHTFDPIWNRIVSTKKDLSPMAPTLEMSRLNMQHINSTNPIKFAEAGKLDIDDTYHYKLFYMQNKSAANMTGNRVIDEKNGIIHLGIGQDRGLLKNISFKRANFPYLREQRVVEENQWNPLSHLADVYNVEISMIGNTIFYPGQYIYVNPLGFGSKLGKPTVQSSASRAMGLGGYHLVTQVSSFIESGKFETRVTALWETSGGPGADRNDRGESTGTRDCIGTDDISTTVSQDGSNIANKTGGAN